MANSTTAAGNNGVAGSYDPTVTRYNSGSMTGGDLSVLGTHAVRQSVVQTAAGAASNVYSETQNLRFAYPVVEADAPAITRT